MHLISSVLKRILCKIVQCCICYYISRTNVETIYFLSVALSYDHTYDNSQILDFMLGILASKQMVPASLVLGQNFLTYSPRNMHFWFLEIPALCEMHVSWNRFIWTICKYTYIHTYILISVRLSNFKDGGSPSSIYSWFLKPLSVLHSRFPTKTTI